MSSCRIRVAYAAIVAACVMMICNSPVLGQTKVGQPSESPLYWIDSPRAIAMGRCSINLVDNQSALHNPGTVALLHFDKSLAVSFPGENPVFSFPLHSSTISTSSISVGTSTKSLNLDSENDKLTFAAGLSYAKSEYDSGPIYSTGYEGSQTELFQWYQDFNCYTASVAAEYFVRLSIGYTYRQIKYKSTSTSSFGNSTSDSYAHDIGTILEIPIADILNWYSDGSIHDQSSIRLELTPSVAYFETRHSQSGTLGLGFRGGLRSANVLLGSLTIVWERDSPNSGFYTHSDRIGSEIGLLGILYVRAGQHSSNILNSANTYGIGLSLHGVLAWMMHMDWITPDNPSFARILSSLDVTADFATSDSFDDYDDPKFFKVGFSF